MTEGDGAKQKGWALLRALASPPLAPDVAEAFAQQNAEQNRRRLLILAAPMLAMHAVHVILYRATDARSLAFPPDVVRWGNSVAWVHAVTFGVTATLAALLFVGGKRPAGRWLPAAAVLTYLLHGAVIAGVDQISVGSGVAPFIGYCIFMAVVITVRPEVSLALYALAGVVFVEAILTMQPLKSLRTALLPNGVSIVVVSFVLSWILFAARRREFLDQATIREQRRVLAALNAGLEQRVQEQVSEIVARATEVESLNAQLQAQVRARSTELSMALAKLAEQRDEGGRLRPGVVLGDRFEIQEPLGEGGMGVVYAGLDRSTRSRVAIKVVQARSSTQLDALHRFLREATVTATVTHPAIVRVLHVDVSQDGLFYQAQELVVGQTLQDAMDAGRTWSPSEAARLVAVLCEGLAEAHVRGIVHRDVKPANMMLTSTAPGLKLLDFGIAKLFEPQGASGERAKTGTGAILGTPLYMAPEQVEGSRDVTAAADVYAVGVVLFVLLAGRHPFDEKTPWGIAYSHMCVEPPDVATLSPNVPPGLSAVVARCLKKAPEDRPTARDLGTELAGFGEEMAKAG